MDTSAVSVADPTTDQPPRRRRWIPLSLRIFGGMMLSLGLGSVLWFGPRACRQYLAIQSVERDGGAVGTWEPKNRIPQFLRDRVRQVFEPVDWVCFPPPGPTTLSAVADDSVACLTSFPDLQYVEIRGTRVTDRALSHLSTISGLRGLSLGGPQVTGEGLSCLQNLPLTSLRLEVGMTAAGYEQLSRFTRLQHLGLYGDRVTDDNLAVIRNFADLRVLSLENTPVTGSGLSNVVALRSLEKLFICKSPAGMGLEHLAGLNGLQHLWLTDTDFDDEDVQHLASVTNLEFLMLARTRVTGWGFARLGGLSKLEMISLRGTLTTDAALQHLSRLPKLDALDLTGTQITDAGLADIERFPKIEQIWLTDTRVTDAGVAKLRRAMPRLIIHE